MRSDNRARGGMRRRLTLNTIAAIGSQMASAYQQLVTVPVFLLAWGAKDYGAWIALYAVFLSLSTVVQFGLAEVVTSEVGMLCAANDEPAALRVFQSVLRVALLISLGSCGFLLLFLRLPVGTLEPGTALTRAAVFLAMQLPLQYLGAFFCATLRGSGHAAEAILYFWVVIRVAESTVAMIVAYCGGDFAAAALAMLGARAAGTALLGAMLRLRVKWVRFGFGCASWGVVRRLLPAGFGHMAVPASVAVNVAGINLIVSLLAGTAAVTVVSVVRTVGNLSFQAFAVIISALWPEVSALIGAHRRREAGDVIRRAGRFAFWATLSVCCGLMVSGNWVFSVWTRGRVHLAWGLFGFQLAGILVASLWRVPSVVLLASNRTTRLGMFSVLASVVSLGIAAGLLPLIGLTAVGIAILAVEVIMAIVSLRAALSFVHVVPVSYLRYVFLGGEFRAE